MSNRLVRWLFILSVFACCWQRDATNTHVQAASSSLTAVKTWLYLIGFNLTEQTVNQMVASDYDMVVIDYVISEVNRTDFRLADLVQRLHQAPHPKLVIAYLDIGQAENYRTYWKSSWKIGNPVWITGDDPDGWQGNFPVAFWHDEWRGIWLDKTGYLQGILDAGYDGVYLDWIEAYSDHNVVQVAQREGVDPVKEIIRWVGDIASFTRKQHPGFVVIGQNAAELSEHDDYFQTVDAISQEQIWFDGAADNNPPGDCPLPRTESAIDSTAYLKSLSTPCRDLYNKYPNSTLHVSSESYLNYLIPAYKKGKVILTVDYALAPENVAWIYKTSRDLGFVPFVGLRALDRYLPPFQ